MQRGRTKNRSYSTLHLHAVSTWLILERCRRKIWSTHNGQRFLEVSRLLVSNLQVVTEADRARMKTFTDMPALIGYNGCALNRQQWKKNLTAPSFQLNPQNTKTPTSYICYRSKVFPFCFLQSAAVVIICTVLFYIRSFVALTAQQPFFMLTHNKAFANAIMHHSQY